MTVNMHQPDALAEKDLGLTALASPFPAAEPVNDYRTHLDLELRVPEQPTVLDLAMAYRQQVAAKLDLEAKRVFQLELDVANAQRIAAAARLRVERLAEELDRLEAQIKSIGGV